MPFPAHGQLPLHRVASALYPDFLSILSESLSERILRHLRTPPASSLRRAVSILSGVWLRRDLRNPSKIFFFLLLASARRAGSNCVDLFCILAF